MSIDLFEPGADYPEARSAVGNLFGGDESTESDGLMSQPVGARDDPAFRPSHAGRWLLRVSLDDNGVGTLAEVLEGVELPLQVQTNISGGDLSTPPPAADTDAPITRPGESGRGVTTPVAVMIGCLLLGLLLTLVAGRWRRSPT